MRHGRERMNRQVFIKLYNLGWPYDDIAHVNEQLTGFRPDKSTVGEWARAFELPPRRMRHADLIPWRIRPEHKSDPIHYALQAISRARRGERRGETLSKQNETLSKQDKLRAAWLRGVLTQRGTLLVVDYDPMNGWCFRPATDRDDDIIRRPVGAASPAGSCREDAVSGT